nr:glycosyltransferase [Pseudomonadota bacterium]
MTIETSNQNPPAPSVAIIIAAYNAEATIARAINSALAEPDVTEVIVVDDASTDGTVVCARRLDDGTGRLKIIQQSPNAGPSAARNRALAESRSDWIGILDADDFFLPGRIKGLVYFAAEADLIADDLWQAPEDQVGDRRRLLGESLAGPRKVGFKEFVLSNISDPRRQRGELGFIKPLMRRSFLDDKAIRYQEHMRLGEDYELYA